MKTLNKKAIAAAGAAAVMCVALCACGGGQSPSNSSSSPSSESSSNVQNTANSNASGTASNVNAQGPNANATAQEPNANAAQQQAVAPVVDVASWQWVPAVLDCYGYTGKLGPCHLSYSFPNGFQIQESNDSGEQTRTYWYNPDPTKATQNEALYYVSAMFLQGGYGPRQESLEPDIEGGFQTRNIGGRDVLFGKMKPQESPDGVEYSGYTFCYYVPYDDEGYARIWILLTDQEENGLFRQTFENSMMF